MHVRLAQAGVGDTHEACFFLQFANGAAAGVAHAGAQAAKQLMDVVRKRPAIGDATFDPFGDQFDIAFDIPLEVAVLAPLLHGAEAAHAAVGLVGAALIKNGFSGGLLGAGKQGPDHHYVSAGGNRLGDFTRILDAAVSDQGHTVFAGDPGHIADGSDLRHTHPGNDAGGADGTRTDADLDRIDPGLDQRLGRLAGGDVAGNQLQVGILAPGIDDGVDNPLGMTMGGVDDNHIDAGGHQRGDTFLAVGTDPDRGTDTQPADIVLAGIGVLAYLLDVLDGDQPLEVPLVVDHQQLFDPVLVQVLLGLFESGPGRHGHQIFLGHDIGDRLVEPGFETQVAVGEDADQLAFLADGNTGDPVGLHQVESFINLLFRLHGDRIDNHAAFRFFHLVDLKRLFGRSHVFVDDAHSPLARHGDGGTCLGHRIHGRRQQRHVETDGRGQLGGDVNLLGQNLGVGRDQQNIVKCQSFGNIGFQHNELLDDESVRWHRGRRIN